MIRKHTRRAVKAAFAIGLGVAIVLGGAAAAGAQSERAQATPIVLGTKNFTEQYVLGELYRQALQAKGFKVAYKQNIGSTEIIDSALTSGKITLYPEYVGVINTVVFNDQKRYATAAAAYAAAKRHQSGRGFALTRQTPFQDVDAIGVLKATAARYGLRTVADLKRVPNLSVAGFPEFQTRYSGLVGMRKAYGVTKVKFVPLAGISAYALLDRKQVAAADVFTTDPQLLSGKYVLLKDPKNIFGFQHVAMVVSKKLVAEQGAKLTRTIDAVSARLTTKAMIALNKAVAIDKNPAAQVAGAFLEANGLK